MEIKSNQEPATFVELVLCDDCLPIFSPLLQQGVMVLLDSETSISPFLYQNLGLSPDFVEQYLATVFLNGKPVDDLDQAILRSGDTLALSAAMPGLVGATMRRKGLLASFRSSISHRPEEDRGPETRIAPLMLKLFNLMIKAVGPTLLENGILLTKRDWEEFLQSSGHNLWDHCRMIKVNGKEVNSLAEFFPAGGNVILIKAKISWHPIS